jgi:RNA polymerase-associated protein
MSVSSSKRSMMTLYVDPNDIYNHVVSITLAEKGMSSVEIIRVNADEKPGQLFELNPYGTTPTLVDRDLVLYHPQVIIEYLDERFPHPPLLPVYPIARAKARLMIHRIEKDWFSLLEQMKEGTGQQSKLANRELFNSLVSIAPVFAEKPFFLSDEFSLVDCCLAALLWQLEKLDLQLPPKAKAIKAYANRLFSRPAFKNSIIEPEPAYE